MTLFTVASITSDRVKLLASPVDSHSGDGRVIRAVDVVNAEFDALFEHNKLPTADSGVYAQRRRGRRRGYLHLLGQRGACAGRRQGRNSDGDSAEHARGFGNCADRRVQSQPYILIKRRELTEKLKKRARELGCAGWEDIRPDTDEQYADSYKETGDKTTVILRLWKDDGTGTVWACECVRGMMVRPPWDLGPDALSRHLAVLGLCAGQLSRAGDAHGPDTEPDLHQQAFRHDDDFTHDYGLSKVVYDRTRVPKWDNGIGKAIGVNGGDVTGVARILDPAQVSPQIAQFIELTQDMTQSNLGATSVALAKQGRTTPAPSWLCSARRPRRMSSRGRACIRASKSWAQFTWTLWRDTTACAWLRSTPPRRCPKSCLPSPGTRCR